MALLQFISAGLPRVAVPTTVHSDHLIVSEKGADIDMSRALGEHAEVYDFLSSASRKYGIGFWKPGSGIIHTVIFENYAIPGGLLIGTDSHSPNAGGLGMMGIGVGGADAVDAMSGMPWELVAPKIVGVRLTGHLSGWTATKDIICKLAGILTVSGGKGRAIEFFGPGCETLGATAMATICNMSAEVGSTSCIFPYSDAMGRYLKATQREKAVKMANKCKATLLTADDGSDSYYDDIIELDLSSLEPYVNGPYTPDLAHPISQFKDTVTQRDWPLKLSHAMVGSCTNSSFEDLEKVRQVVAQARSAGLSRFKTPFMVSPGSEQIRATAEANGILQELREAGALVLSSSCGPCVGSWDRKDVDVTGKEKNSVISSYNRNFVGRHDSNPATHSFVTSPELVTTFAYAGRLDFNPLTDSIISDKAAPNSIQFRPPVVQELPPRFEAGLDTFQEPSPEGDSLSVTISPDSDRLQLLRPFPSWEGGCARNMELLIKVKGKCTTDHISPAGPWYKYRGHLENISNNMLTTATNAFLDDPRMLGHTRNPLTNHIQAVPQVARDLKEHHVPWCIVGDYNYGEGSSREHAALEPRYLGGVTIISRSFARIHETNLKKQGMLPLTFDDPADYDLIRDGDRITLIGVEDDDFHPGSQVTMQVKPQHGDSWEAKLNHSYHAGQIPWLRAGSALNHIKATLSSK
ncbi:aconitate hydratase 1 [Talaromyces islandicus]|uniref:Aconitate hydratase, mitochondrial n=1 Tax=Talaromyces islandicus TaxID=28573 RepID=A0A0U1LP42_TALIS|nr:aconitate hydratase 1 [Talaromyces islandicus]